MIECYGTPGDGCADGGIAQLARAIGSYPIGRGFKSNFRYHGTGNGPAIRPVGQAAKTPPFHGGNGGSIPPRVKKKKSRERLFLFVLFTILSSFFSLLFVLLRDFFQ